MVQATGIENEITDPLYVRQPSFAGIVTYRSPGSAQASGFRIEPIAPDVTSVGLIPLDRTSVLRFLGTYYAAMAGPRWVTGGFPRYRNAKLVDFTPHT